MIEDEPMYWEICDQACDVCEEMDCPIVEDLKADYDDNDECYRANAV